MPQKLRKVEVFDAFDKESGEFRGTGSAPWTKGFLVPVRIERRLVFLAGHFDRVELDRFEKGLPCDFPQVGQSAA